VSRPLLRGGLCRCQSSDRSRGELRLLGCVGIACEVTLASTLEASTKSGGKVWPGPLPSAVAPRISLWSASSERRAFVFIHIELCPAADHVLDTEVFRRAISEALPFPSTVTWQERICHALPHWTSLTRYLDNGAVETDSSCKCVDGISVHPNLGAHLDGPMRFAKNIVRHPSSGLDPRYAHEFSANHGENANLVCGKSRWGACIALVPTIFALRILQNCIHPDIYYLKHLSLSPETMPEHEPTGRGHIPCREFYCMRRT
jgi:hypothetical protein